MEKWGRPSLLGPDARSVTVEIKGANYIRLDAVAQEDGVNLATVIRRAIDEYLQERDGHRHHGIDPQSAREAKAAESLVKYLKERDRKHPSHVRNFSGRLVRKSSVHPHSSKR
jgi:hypothetical protein